MNLNLSKYNFTKTEKNLWVFWEDYVMEHINPEYGYYLYATLHAPIEPHKSLKDRFYKILVHRTYIGPSHMEESLKEGESIVVYEGLIEDNNDLDFLMGKLGLIKQILNTE